MRAHVLSVPHAETSLKYIACAFTQKVFKWCPMMLPDLEVYHYGHEASTVECTEHITVTTHKDLQDALKWNIEKKGLKKSYNPIKDGFVFDVNDPASIAFRNNAEKEIRKRYQPNDFLLCFWGTGHLPLVNMLSDLDDLHVVEPGIGYPQTFAKYRVFESSAKMHLVRGQQHERYFSAGSRDNNVPYTYPNWFDIIIPNYWIPETFNSQAEKDESIFFIGRLGKYKGLEVAVKLAGVSGRKLFIAGQGDLKDALGYEPNCDYEYLGVVDEQTRNDFMKRADCGVTASMYIDPFCGTHAEFWFNETGVLTTPWGVFAETVINGYNGYKCTAFDGGNKDDPSFIFGLNNMHKIKPKNCYKYAVDNFSIDAVRPKYINYFQRILNHTESIKSGKDPFFFRSLAK